MKGHNLDQLGTEQLSYLRQIKRSVISRNDLEYAKGIAVLIVNNGSSKIEHGDIYNIALDTALRVTYARPFTTNYPGTKRDIAQSLDDSVLTVLNEHQRDIHKFIMKTRNTMYAHSDGDLFDINLSIHKNEGHAVSISSDYYLPIRPLSKEAVTTVVHICDRLISHLYTLELELSANLPDGDYFAR